MFFKNLSHKNVLQLLLKLKDTCTRTVLCTFRHTQSLIICIITHPFPFSQTNPLIIFSNTHTHTQTRTFNLIPDPRRTPWPWHGQPFVLSSLWRQDPCLLGPDPPSTSQSVFDNPQALPQALPEDGLHLIER